MITINGPIEIPSDDIFKNDLLDRKETIENLSRLIIGNTQPSVLSVNAGWGAGKTTFIKLWQKHLEKEHEVSNIYFSAWEDDFTSDPLIAILRELDVYLEENKEALNEKLTEELTEELKGEIENFKKMGIKIIRDSLPAVLKGMIVKFIGDEAFAQIASDLAEKSATALIDNYQEEKTTLESFKNSITKILKAINKDKPFIIFIDELDRCRPLYAIECLERIKHIFGIERLVFVLAIDKKNLAQSIQSQYGNIDTNNYLRRFINLEFDLKNPDVDDFCNVLCDKFELNDIFKSKGIYINVTDRSYSYLYAIKTLTAGLNLSLRQIEQIFTKLKIIVKTTEHGILPHHFLVLVLFEAVKSYDNNLYLGLINGKTKAKEKIKVLIATIQGDGLEYFKLIISAIIDATALSGHELDDLIKQKEYELSEINNDGSQEHSELQYYINLLQNPFDKGLRYRYNHMAEDVIKKIDFANKFNLN